MLVFTLKWKTNDAKEASAISANKGKRNDNEFELRLIIKKYMLCFGAYEIVAG